MTPVPIELPVRPGEASVVADLVFQTAEGRMLTDDLRARLAVQAGTLGLKSLRPFFGSLEADPIHRPAYYLAVDGLARGMAQPLLLHMAGASAPASAWFPRALLIGRMRPGGGREILINSVPFGPRDTRHVAVYVEALGRAFLPRPKGGLPVVTVRTTECESAFQAFRAHWKTTGLNVASFEVNSSQEFYGVVWAAIRSGWRDGYAIGVADESDAAGLASRIIIAETDLQRYSERLQKVRDARLGRAFDVELRLPAHFSPQACGTLLARLRDKGILPHLVSFDGMPADSSRAAVLAAGVRCNPLLNEVPPPEAIDRTLRNYMSM